MAGQKKRLGGKGRRRTNRLRSWRTVSSQTSVSVKGGLLADSADSTRRPHSLGRARPFVERSTDAGHLSAAPLQRCRRRREGRRARSVTGAGGASCGFERFEEATLASGSGGKVGWCRGGRSLRREEEFGSGEGERVVRGRVGSQESRERDGRRDSLSTSARSKPGQHPTGRRAEKVRSGKELT